MELKKRILRTVISEIIVDVNHASGQIEMRIHRAGGVHTMLGVRKNQVGRKSNATDKNVVELTLIYTSTLALCFWTAYLRAVPDRTLPRSYIVSLWDQRGLG
jgi:hypothetical protein